MINHDFGDTRSSRQAFISALHIAIYDALSARAEAAIVTVLRLGTATARNLGRKGAKKQRDGEDRTKRRVKQIHFNREKLDGWLSRDDPESSNSAAEITALN